MTGPTSHRRFPPFSPPTEPVTAAPAGSWLNGNHSIAEISPRVRARKGVFSDTPGMMNSVSVLAVLIPLASCWRMASEIALDARSRRVMLNPISSYTSRMAHSASDSPTSIFPFGHLGASACVCVCEKKNIGPPGWMCVYEREREILEQPGWMCVGMREREPRARERARVRAVHTRACLQVHAHTCTYTEIFQNRSRRIKTTMKNLHPLDGCSMLLHVFNIITSLCD